MLDYQEEDNNNSMFKVRKEQSPLSRCRMAYQKLKVMKWKLKNILECRGIIE